MIFSLIFLFIYQSINVVKFEKDANGKTGKDKARFTEQIWR